MKRVLLGVGFVLILLPLVLMALHNVSIMVGSAGFGYGQGGLAVGGAVIRVPMAYAFPLPPKKLLEELGVTRIEIGVRASNSSIYLYIVPESVLEKLLNVSRLVKWNASSVWQFLSQRFSLFDTIIEKNPELLQNPEKMNKMVNSVMATLSKFEIAKGENELRISLSNTGNNNLCIVYTPNASTFFVYTSIYVRIVRHLDMRTCIASIVLGCALLALGIAIGFKSWRRTRELLY